jgi:hypothetical protein
MRYRLAFLLAGAGASAHAALATGYDSPRDLDASGLIPPLPCYNVDVIQRGKLPQQPHQCRVVRAHG